MQTINNVLVSVTDKTGLTDFIHGLKKINPNLTVIASGGTAKALEEANIEYTPLSSYTGFPECFSGRVKTLHPHIAGGILMRRGTDDDEAHKLGIKPIDLVVCNLYNFADAAKDNDMPMEQLIEQMDIGGSTLIRASCKNFAHVGIIIDPADYKFILQEGGLTDDTRKKLAVKAINHSADYEALLAGEFAKRLQQEEISRLTMSGGRKLRYGENPDQEARLFKFNNSEGIAQAILIAGKEPSYNNYEDATVAYNAAQELQHLNVTHGVAVIKHGSLCGYASGSSIVEAFDKAWEGDSKSAFGSVIALTSTVELELSDSLKGKFVEVLIAPHFSDAFVAWTKEHRPNLRLMQAPQQPKEELQYKNVSGGMLVQTRKKRLTAERVAEMFDQGVVTKLSPSKDQAGLYAFGIAAVNFAKSNATAIVREWTPGYYQLVGIGAGQPNRVDSLQRLAIPKAVENLTAAHANDAQYNAKADLGRCVLATDGFFPFDDSVRYAASMGIKHCIQPGGGKRDEEVTKAADELEMTMICTGERYFSH
ncbi:MAG: bifunctional phosphoribosylaminoimidazolecarboxamide formyltransferase/IMP cyclohydrolase [Chlamydiales bacterium]|nr:bifunctional phosphoribosylaminoimidazolecarboxamide formyltransferase/IMP cyclohydrolase [Chlamydiia bacterium]MCP5508489.1 bifunctional phosphoribosylaminoimidazolecarboxamide formyltransferase/IMP cyclohydrolase [Chlamydiales bacterium]